MRNQKKYLHLREEQYSADEALCVHKLMLRAAPYPFLTLAPLPSFLVRLCRGVCYVYCCLIRISSSQIFVDTKKKSVTKTRLFLVLLFARANLLRRTLFLPPALPPASRNQKKATMTSRDDLVYMAKLAEQAER